MSPRTGRLGGLGFPLLVLAVLSALFPTLVFSGHVLFERDLHQMLYGQYASLTRTLSAGSLPVWDPWPGFGQPMLGNPAAQVLYPPTWLCLVLEPGHAYTAYVFLHLVVGALATRALARRLGLSPLGASAAGLLWLLSGPVWSLINLWHHLAGAALMPVVWLAAETLLREPTLRRAVLLGGAMGLQALAGSLDMCVLTAGLTLGYGLYDRKHPSKHPPLRRLVAPLAVAAGVTLALAAGLLLPALEVWRGSARTALGESLRASWSLRPLLLPQAVVPVFPQALPLSPSAREQIFDGDEPFLASIYLGLASVPLVAIALSGRFSRPTLFLVAAFLAAALLALGRHGLAYPALVSFLPPLRSLRYPVKATVAMVLPWALLAGLGLDRLRGAAPGDRRPWPALAAGASAILAAAVLGALLLAPPAAWLPSAPVGSAVPRRLFVAAGIGALVLVLLAVRGLPAPRRALGLLVLAVLDLGLAHRTVHATAPGEVFRTPPAILAHLPGGGFARIHAWDYASRIVGKPYRRAEPVLPHPGAPSAASPSLAVARARHDFLSPPVAARFGVHGAFDRDWLGLQPRGVRNLGLVFQAREETSGFLPLLRMGAVSHVVSLHREGLEELEEVAAEASPYAGPVYLRRVPDPLPRAYAVGGVRIADGASALGLLLSPQFDAGREVILPQGAETPAPAPFVGDVRIEEARPDRLRLVARLTGPGHVVVLDAWDTGWHAWVDGRKADVLRANVGFRAVPVPEGSHELVLLHRPGGLALGLAASASAALLVLAAVAVRGRASPGGEE